MKNNVVVGLLALAVVLLLLNLVVSLKDNSAYAAPALGSTQGGGLLAMPVYVDQNKQYALVINTDNKRMAAYGVNNQGKIGVYSVRWIEHDLSEIWQYKPAPDSITVREMKEFAEKAKELAATGGEMPDDGVGGEDAGGGDGK